MKKVRLTVRVAVLLLLIKDNKILLQRRFNTGWMDGKYSLVSGHLEEGEIINQAIIREVAEEAGIALDPKDLKVVQVMHRQSDFEYMDIFLTADNWQGEVKNMEPHRCDDLSWFDLNKLPENLIPNIQFAIKNYQNHVFFSEFEQS